MQNQSPTHDDLIAGANIAAKLIAENPDLETGVIDLVISQAFHTSADPVQWEASVRMLLALRAAEAEEAEEQMTSTLNEQLPRFPHVTLYLEKEEFKPAAVVMSKVARLLRDAGVGEIEIEDYLKRAGRGNYENFLIVTRNFVTVL